MRITESRLREIIRSVIKESYGASERTPEEEKADILARFPDPYSMPELEVEDVKFLLGLEHNKSKALTYIPKFLRKHFGDGNRTGPVSISISDLRDMGFEEHEINKLTEIAKKVFRSYELEIIESELTIQIHTYSKQGKRDVHSKTGSQDKLIEYLENLMKSYEILSVFVEEGDFTISQEFQDRCQQELGIDCDTALY